MSSEDGAPVTTGRVRGIVWLAIIASASIALIVVGTRLGPGLSPDSMSYLSAGRNLAQSGRLVNFVGEPLTAFPPGLPVLIALGDWLGASGTSTFRLISVISVALVVVLSHVLLRRHVASPFVLWTATVWVAVSPAFLEVSRMVWTEGTFIATTLAMLVVLGLLYEERAAWPIMLWVALLCWVAFSLRYAGLALVPVAALSLLWVRRARIVEACLLAGGFLVVALSAPLAWTARNRSRNGTSFGRRAPSSLNVLDVAADLKDTSAQWVVPFGPDRFRVVLAVVLFGAVVAIAAVAGRSGQREEARRPADGFGIAPVVIFLIVYVLYVTVAELRYTLDPIDNRLLSPIYVPAVVLAAIAFDRAAHLPLKQHDRVRTIGMLAVAAYVGGHALVSVGDTKDAYTDGVGYRSRAPVDSELAVAVRQLPEVSFVASNAPDLYLFWGVARQDPVIQVVSTDLTALAIQVSCAEQPAYLAWYGAPESAPSSSDLVAVTAVSSHIDGMLQLLTASDQNACPTRADP